MSINQVTLVGNLTRDPELRQAGDTSVTDLGVAVNDRVKRDGEWQDEASFIDVTVWGKQAENCAKYLGKGSPVGVAGRLKQDRWQNDAGENRSKVKVVAYTVQFLSSRNGSEGVDAPSPASAEVDAPADDSHLPF